jgi:four helix bundle protein
VQELHVLTKDSRTKPDFIAKMAISRKESRETGYWLRLSVAAGLIKRDHVSWELDEADQLRRMIRAAIMTAESSDDRGELEDVTADRFER